MSRKNKIQIIENVEIIDVGAEGKAIARVENKVVFVPYVAPGDVVDIQVIKRKKNYYEGKVLKFVSKSKNHIASFCQHFQVCGGCKWQHLSYDNQLKFKEQQVVDNLLRIGKIEIEKINPILASEKTEFYRNKLEFTFSNRRWLLASEIELNEDLNRNALGFHVPGLFDKVVNIEKCYLQKDPSNRIRTALHSFAEKNNLEYFDLRNQTGFLRNLIIRNTSTGELMVIVVFYHENKTNQQKVLNFLQTEFPEINSLMYAINEKPNDSLADQQIYLFAGNDHIMEQMEGLQFKIGPKSFYQTNSEQAYRLYSIARNFAGLNGDEIVYDLYTGTGTIANFIARNAKKVIGIEFIEEAIADAKVNSELNNIHNTVFYSGDMKDLLTEEFIIENGRPNVIITDPPRAGMHKKVVETILRALPQKIVYVSCNPATQARDIQLLSENYSLQEIQPVDMFPHTHHVENVALLLKK